MTDLSSVRLNQSHARRRSDAVYRQVSRSDSLSEEGYEVVYGIRERREEALLMRAARRIYYRLANELSYLELVPGVGEFQLVDRCVAAVFRQFDDYYPYVRGMVAYCGFRRTGVAYTWNARRSGITKNSLLRLIDQVLVAVFGGPVLAA